MASTARSAQARPAAGPSVTLQIAAAAIMAAVVTVFTAVIQVPNPSSGGYFNLSDVAIIFAAIAFGPWVGLAAGGIGTAIADVMLGYATFAPISFIAHGVEGLIAGWIALRRPSWLFPAWIAGVVWMVAAYFVGTSLLLGTAQAVADLVGTNWIQALAGVLGVALYYAVRAAYPAIVNLRGARTWTEL
jgi:uncharacterized membrane protein